MHFYSRASCEARRLFLHTPCRLQNFYSRASCEARPFLLYLVLIIGIFLLTRLLRGATKDLKESHAYLHISTHAPLARRDISSLANAPKLNDISTHAPLARRDRYSGRWSLLSGDFYSRASCEARLPELHRHVRALPFLLTRLLRGATSEPCYSV